MREKLASFNWHASILLAYLAQNLKVRMSYRADFIVSIMTTLLYSVVQILFFWAIFKQVPEVRGWDLNEVLLIYGFSELSFGTFSILGLRFVFMLPGSYIVDAELDRPLLRPLHPMFQLVMENADVFDLAIVLKALGIIIYALVQLSIPLTALLIFKVLFFGLIGGVIYFAMFTTAASLSFWVKDRAGVYQPLFDVNNFSRFPIGIFPHAVRFFFSLVVPFAFAAFFPAASVLEKGYDLPLGSMSLPNATIAWLCLPVAMIGISIALTVFNAGLKSYESSGH